MDTERASALLLVAMYQNNEANPVEYAVIDRLPGWGELGLPRLRVVIGHLQQAGLVQPISAASMMAWRLTPVGVVRAEKLLHDRDRPIVRYDTAVNGLVTAAVDEFPEHRLELADFARSRHAEVLDTVLTLDEISSAVTFLETEKLITVERTDGRPTAVTLTSRGRECGWADKTDVRNYLTGRQPSGIHQNWNIAVHGGAPQIGHGNVQHHHGPDLDQVMRFARELHDLVSKGSMPVAETLRDQIVEDAEALEREVGLEMPQPSRVRRLLESLQENLATSGAQMALMAVERLL
ncbi:hypothetical protein ABZ946_16740 [Streptomyces sp. NPDC046324]|uniref:hypothetical protein n=1 Tax=Streptomyces sp. NPDC046324 TaxID=3154915 RepID=UPI0034064F9B